VSSLKLSPKLFGIQLSTRRNVTITDQYEGFEDFKQDTWSKDLRGRLYEMVRSYFCGGSDSYFVILRQWRQQYESHADRRFQ
jgi:hypothetical protein